MADRGTNERAGEGFVYEDPRAAFEAYQRARTVGRHKDRKHKRARAARSTRGRMANESSQTHTRAERYATGSTTEAEKNTRQRTNTTERTDDEGL